MSTIRSALECIDPIEEGMTIMIGGFHGDKGDPSGSNGACKV